MNEDILHLVSIMLCKIQHTYVPIDLHKHLVMHTHMYTHTHTYTPTTLKNVDWDSKQ